MFQFPTPPSPGEIPPPTSFDQLVACLFISMMSVFVLSMLLPHPLFCKLFRIAFPFMPERLEDFDD